MLLCKVCTVVPILVSVVVFDTLQQLTTDIFNISHWHYFLLSKYAMTTIIIVHFYCNMFNVHNIIFHISIVYENIRNLFFYLLPISCIFTNLRYSTTMSLMDLMKVHYKIGTSVYTDSVFGICISSLILTYMASNNEIIVILITI